MPTAVALCQKWGSERLSRKVSGIGNKTFDILRALPPVLKPNLSHKVTKIGSAGAAIAGSLGRGISISAGGDAAKLEPSVTATTRFRAS
jgi:hypothetical protein